MPPPRRTVLLPRPAAPSGVGVVKITEVAEDGWESPSWYMVRELPADHDPGRLFALVRLTTRQRYTVRITPTQDVGGCECLGSGGDGSAACRHLRALSALIAAGRL